MSIRTELERLAQRDGFLTPAQVLAEAAAADSPLHAHFEWDDAKAGHQFRLYQARTLIMRCRITIEVSEDETRRIRQFVNIPGPDGGAGTYVPTVDALSDDRRIQVLGQARRELAAFRRKYEALIDVDKLLAEAIQQPMSEAS